MDYLLNLSQINYDFSKLTLTTPNIIKVSLIFIFFIISLAGKDYISQKEKNIQSLALFLTFISDIFLVILNWQAIGVFVFIFVQICYSIKIEVNKRLFFIYPIIFILIFIALDKILLAFAIFYGFLFITNYITACKKFVNKKYPKPNNYLILFGLGLFLLCDITVALYNSHNINVELGSDILKVLGNAIWIFYIPSQFLLSISSRKYRISKLL